MRCKAEITDPQSFTFRADRGREPRCRRTASKDGLCYQHARVLRARYGFVKLSRREIEWIRSL